MNNQKLCFFIMFVFLFFIGFSKGAEISNDNYIERIFKPEDEKKISEKLMTIFSIGMQGQIVLEGGTIEQKNFFESFFTARNCCNWKVIEGEPSLLDSFIYAVENQIWVIIKNIKKCLSDEKFLQETVEIGTENKIVGFLLSEILKREEELLKKSEGKTCLDEQVPDFLYSFKECEKFQDVSHQDYSDIYKVWLEFSQKRENPMIFSWFLCSRLLHINNNDEEGFKNNMKYLIKLSYSHSLTDLEKSTNYGLVPMHLLFNSTSHYIQFKMAENRLFKDVSKTVQTHHEGYLCIVLCQAIMNKVDYELKDNITKVVQFVLKNSYSLFFDEVFFYLFSELRKMLTELYLCNDLVYKKKLSSFLCVNLDNLLFCWKEYINKKQKNSNDKQVLVGESKKIFNQFYSLDMNNFLNLSEIDGLDDVSEANITKIKIFLNKIAKLLSNQKITEEKFKEIGDSILNTIKFYFKLRWLCLFYIKYGSRNLEAMKIQSGNNVTDFYLLMAINKLYVKDPALFPAFLKTLKFCNNLYQLDELMNNFASCLESGNVDFAYNSLKENYVNLVSELKRFSLKSFVAWKEDAKKTNYKVFKANCGKNCFKDIDQEDISNIIFDLNTLQKIFKVLIEEHELVYLVCDKKKMNLKYIEKYIEVLQKLKEWGCNLEDFQLEECQKEEDQTSRLVLEVLSEIGRLEKLKNNCKVSN